MQFNDFSGLTDFIYVEVDKLKDSLDVKRTSSKFTTFVEESIMKYIKLYDKPLFIQQKKELSIQIAINTMPHGFIWKFFHPGLWRVVKERLNITKEPKQKKSKEEKKEQTYFPEVVKAFDVPQTSDLDSFN